MALLRESYLLLWKDLLLELRRRDSLLTMFFFGTLLLFVFHFSFDPAPDKVAEIAPALLWLAFLFTGTLGLAQLFQSERENHCLDALLLSPLDRGALFLAKTCFNLVLMLIVEIVVMPLFWILLIYAHGICYRNCFWLLYWGRSASAFWARSCRRSRCGRGRASCSCRWCFFR